MRLSQVAPELRGPLRRLPPIPFASGLVRRLAQWMLARTPAAHVDGVWLEVRSDVGAGVRIHLPQVRKSRGALLWLHGGGFVIGRPVQDDRLCATTAREVGVPVVSAAYRLAPKHPFPAALDDAHAVWTWLQQAVGQLDIDPARIAVGGQSAGGAIAASLVQRLQDEAPGRVGAQWLFCPMLDDRTAARRDLDDPRHFLWSNRDNLFAWRSYLAAEPGAAEPPRYAAPARRERLDGLPQAWIGVGEIDLFLEEDRAYAARLQASGVATRIVTVPGAPHGFEAWAPASPQARDLIADAQAWLRTALA